MTSALQAWDAALERAADKITVPSSMRTAEWARVPLAVRERAFFSAAVASARDLQFVRDRTRAALQGQHPSRRRDDGTPMTYSRQEAIADIREHLGIEGDSGKLTDFGSYRRQQLIQDFQAEQAYSFGRWKRDLEDPEILDEFPAQRFTRVEPRKVPRTTWFQRWAEAGNAVGWAGASTRRMVALKTSPIWRALSRFGTPYPPFDFGSGMGVEDVSREEVEAMGLIPEGWDPETEGRKALDDFNSEVEASVDGLDEETRAWLTRQLGDLGRITGDRIHLVSNFASPRPVDGDWQPKASVTGQDNSLDGLSASAKRRIGRAESEIAEQPIEVGLLFNSSGRVTRRLKGNSNIIQVSDEAASKLKGAVFSHNHPTATPPSVLDVVNASRFGLSELRVVHGDWIWVLKPAKGGAFPPESRVKGLIGSWLRTLQDVPTAQEMHDWLVVNAPGLGLNYIVKGRA